ncbi:type II CRISPR RNA-guided endonuclease Cas9 [Helicobacter sp. 16-1353]|uniref:type II CRISPR RNA-guided endonuclease Cas9 n=1 Tax=Helicobacter sp. 16-1353 TaxID=2004996 RepID=UPI0015EEB6BC|nr:type II CRISPR RNA-guided endonuclease Cas9 [Helicobacter sp. 16-1353]
MRVLGLDVGVTSVGWAVVSVDNDDKSKNKIEKCGVRLFEGVAQDRHENLKCAIWASAKSSRNRFKARRKRLNEIKKVFEAIGFIDFSFDFEAFHKNLYQRGENIYTLRAKSLKEKIEKIEIFACIYHLAKHRGYRSGPVINVGKKEGSKVKILETREKLQGKTFAQFLVENNANATQPTYRNRGEEARFMADKDMIECEVRAILEKQGECYYDTLDSAFIQKIIDIINQKSASINKDFIENMLGNCQFEKEEKRTSSDTLTAIISRILQKINNIKIIENGEIKNLINAESGESKSAETAQLVQKLLLAFFKDYELSYAKIREIAKLDENAIFKDLNYKEFVIKEIYKIFKDYLPKTSQKAKNGDSANSIDSANVSQNSKNPNVFKHFPTFAQDLYGLLQSSQFVESKVPESSTFKMIIESNLAQNKAISDISNLESRISSLKKLSNYKSGLEKEANLFADKNLKMIAEALEALNLKFDSVESIFEKRDFIDSIIFDFFFYKDYLELEEHLSLKVPDKNARDKVANELFQKVKGTSNLSLKALKKIEPFLLQGYKYTEACEKAGYSKEESTQRFTYLPLMRDAMKMGLIGVNNPRVRKINNQVIKLINELIRRKIYFDRIHIELARDIPQTKNEAIEKAKSNKEVEKLKKQAIEPLSDILGANPNPKDILKARLWLEQNERCPYCGEKLVRTDWGHFDIDHIKPLPRSYDNTYSNKVLAHKSCNQSKGMRLPLEWLSGEAAEKYRVRVEGLANIGKRKLKNLLMLEIKDEDIENPRILTESRYAVRFLKNYIEKHLDFERFSPESNLPKSKEGARFQRVQTRNGGVTNILRNYWHIGAQDSNNIDESMARYKKDRLIHTHHAEDAIILAFATQGIVQKIHTIATEISLSHDTKEAMDYTTGEITITESAQNAKHKAIQKRLHSSAPLENMPQKVENAIRNIFPSRMATRRKQYGQIHDDTIYSVRDKSNNYKKLSKAEVEEKIQAKDIENLVIIKTQKLSDKYAKDGKAKLEKNLENMIDKDTRNKKLYEAIKAFINSDESECKYAGVAVRGFKYYEKFTPTALFIRGGVATRSLQQKYLVYKKNGFYYIGLVYFGDNIGDDKNARVQITDKDKDYEYREYSDNGYSYEMTLHKNDLIYYEQENKSLKDGVERHVYYIDLFNTARKSAQMFFKDPVVSQTLKTNKKGETADEKYSPSVKFGKLSHNNITKLEKLEIDLLGNVYRIVNGEKTNFTKEALAIMHAQKAEAKSKESKKSKKSLES